MRRGEDQYHSHVICGESPRVVTCYCYEYTRKSEMMYTSEIRRLEVLGC